MKYLWKAAHVSYAKQALNQRNSNWNVRLSVKWESTKKFIKALLYKITLVKASISLFVLSSIYLLFMDCC